MRVIQKIWYNEKSFVASCGVVVMVVVVGPATHIRSVAFHIGPLRRQIQSGSYLGEKTVHIYKHIANIHYVTIMFVFVYTISYSV